MGITNCKTALVTKTTFLRLSKKNTEMVHNLFPTDNVNYYITIIITFEKNIIFANNNVVNFTTE